MNNTTKSMSIEYALNVFKYYRPLLENDLIIFDNRKFQVRLMHLLKNISVSDIDEILNQTTELLNTYRVAYEEDTWW